MNKQKSSGGQSKQSVDESGNRGSEQGAKNETSDKRGKDVSSTPKSGGKGKGAKQKRKH